MRLHAPWALFVLPAAAACASAVTTKAQTPRVDLGPARTAVEEARNAGAPQRAAETFKQAEAHLKEAEGLVEHGVVGANEAQMVEFLGRLATAEALCSTNLAHLATAEALCSTNLAHLQNLRADDSDASSRLRRAAEEERRSEEHT